MTSYAIHHINGKPQDNDISNLSVIDILENLGGITMISKVLTKNPGNIVIISGEGNNGTFELFAGKRTELAINRRLAKERCNGDRWAKAFVYLHESETGKVYMDLHSSDMQEIDDDDIS